MKKLVKMVLSAWCVGLRLLLAQSVLGAEATRAAELPQAWRLFTVRVPEMENARCILTSTDDLRTVTSDGSELEK